MSVKRLTREEKLAIAKDFYKSAMSPHAIGRKYQVSPNTVDKVANEFEQVVTNKKYLNTKQKVMVFDAEEFEIAVKILNEFRVKFVAPDYFEIEAQFESKINLD